MAKTLQAVLRSKKRAEMRRTQILDGARACVRAEGFHAASMTRIAAAAGMTAGHIYQYFENKEAVMIALAQRDFDEIMAEMGRSVPPSGGWTKELIIRAFVSEIPALLDYHTSSIALELQVEAGRNPKVAELVSGIDKLFRTQIRDMLKAVFDELSDEEIGARIEMLLIMSRSLALYSATHPVVNADMVARGFELAMQGLLESPEPVDLEDPAGPS